MFYIYILKRRAKRSLYIGYTSDLKRRILQHKEKYPAEQIYFECCCNEKLARKRELKLKYYGSAWRGLKKRLELA